ncbi:MAG: protein arginine kinase [Planctomycetota bacterium]
MTLSELTQTTGEWLRGEGPLNDVVVSSRIRLARNLAGFPFLSTAVESNRREIHRAVVEQVTASTLGKDELLIDLDEVGEVNQHLLVERHLISRQHAAGEGSRGVTVSPNETRAIMVNEEDHLRIQGLRCGMQLETIWNDVNEVDNVLSQNLPFAFDQQLGYLTACPTNVGTGIRVSVMLHLPGLRFTKEIEKVARAARDLRLAVRGLHGEGTEAVGDLYQVSNQTTLGKTETSIIETFSQTIIPRIVDYERAARDTLAKQHATRLDDKIWRAYGVLCGARRISTNETQTMLSPIRMGIHMGRFNKFDLKTLNELFLFTQPAHLQRVTGKALDENTRAAARADYLRSRLN